MQTKSLNLKTKNHNLNLKTDLKKRTYFFSIDVIRFLRHLPKDYLYQTIGKHLLRSSTSIGANIIEAQGASSKRDFINFFHIALKSANETKYWLCLLRDAGNLREERVKKLLQEAIEISNMLGSSILTMKGRKKF